MFRGFRYWEGKERGEADLYTTVFSGCLWRPCRQTHCTRARQTRIRLRQKPVRTDMRYFYLGEKEELLREG